LEGPVETEAVENSPRFFAAHFHFRAGFIGRKRSSFAKIHLDARCGKDVKTVWTRRDEFGYFSLAHGVSFRQNPAAQLNLARLRISIFARRCPVGVRSGPSRI
jgi:hypothetical protein